nr:hypothetical protein [Tanacetum cinerariifolium]
MRTRSSSNILVVSPSNPSTSNPKRRNRRRSKQHFILEESPVDTMADQRTMAKLLRAPTEGYAEAILCLAAGGNTFPELRDNIQGYVSTAAVNYNQGNSVYRPLGSGSLLSNTVTNPKGELKAITTQSGLVLDGPFVPTPPPFINTGEDERVDETLTDQDLSKYTIKVPPHPVQKYKPLSQRDYVVYQRDPLHPNILYPSRTLKQKHQEKDEKMLKALLSNKEKLQELANKPLDENCSAKLGLPELISTRMALELANRAIYTPVGIARDVFVPVGKFTFPANIVIVDCESDPRPSGNRTFSSHPELTSPKVKDDIFDPEVGNVLPKKLLDLDSTKDLHPPLHVNPLSGNTTYSSFPNQLLKEFADELSLITFPTEYDDDLQFDNESDLKEIEYVLHHDSIKDIDSSLKDSIDQIKSDAENVYDDPFDYKGEKIKEFKLLIDELNLPCDFLPSEYDSIFSEDFSTVDALPSTNNEDKLAISNASLMLEDCDPPLYELFSLKKFPVQVWRNWVKLSDLKQALRGRHPMLILSV